MTTLATKVWRGANPEKVIAYSRTWRRKNRFRTALKTSRTTANRLGHMPCLASLEEIETAFTDFCHICGKPERECHTRLHLEHCHQTGKFRGWLCYRCNSIAGFSGDSPELLLAIAIYLEK